jgi:hypothetical protein
MWRFGRIMMRHRGLVVRDAARCAAPHHEGLAGKERLEDLILKSGLSAAS